MTRSCCQLKKASISISKQQSYHAFCRLPLQDLKSVVLLSADCFQIWSTVGSYEELDGGYERNQKWKNPWKNDHWKMLKGLLFSGKQLVKTFDRQSNIQFNLSNVRHIIFFIWIAFFSTMQKSSRLELIWMLWVNGKLAFLLITFLIIDQFNCYYTIFCLYQARKVLFHLKTVYLLGWSHQEYCHGLFCFAVP